MLPVPLRLTAAAPVAERPGPRYAARPPKVRYPAELLDTQYAETAAELGRAPGSDSGRRSAWSRPARYSC
jgi:hypothetical protein